MADDFFKYAFVCCRWEKDAIQFVSKEKQNESRKKNKERKYLLKTKSDTVNQ